LKLLYLGHYKISSYTVKTNRKGLKTGWIDNISNIVVGIFIMRAQKRSIFYLSIHFLVFFPVLSLRMR